LKKLRLILLTPFLSAIVAWWLYSQLAQPQPFHVTADPELPYLFSSLSVFEGHSYSFIDHPGTPLEMLGTLMLGMTYPFVKNLDSSFTLYYINHPGVFLMLARGLLSLMSIGAIITLGLRTIPGKHWTDALAATGVGVLYFGIHPKAFESIVHWSHNSFSFPLGAILVLGLVVLIVNQNGGSAKGQAILGFAIGILVAIQLYFITWLVGAVVALWSFSILSEQGWKPGWVSSWRVSVAAVVGFIISTLPIATRYADFVGWIVKVASHQGRHGSGQPGFLSLSAAKANFMILWSELPLLFILIGILGALTVVMALFQRKMIKANPALWALMLGLNLQIGLMTLLVIKHPGIIYMQAVAAIVPLLVAVVISLLWKSFPSRQSMLRLLKFGIGIVAAILFFAGLFRAIFIHRAVTQQVTSTVEDIQIYLDEVASEQERERHSLTTLWIYGMPSDCLALWYGNQYADYTLAEEVNSRCPRDLIFDLWENRVVRSDGTLVPLDGSGWDIIVANEAGLIDFPQLSKAGSIVYSEARLGTFGRVLYILPVIP